MPVSGHMIDFVDAHEYKLRFLVAAGLIVCAILLLPLLLSVKWTNNTVLAAETKPKIAESGGGLKDSPNVITSGMVRALDSLGKITSSTEQAISSSYQSAAKSIAGAGVQSGKFAANSIFSAGNFTANIIARGFTSAVRGAGSGFGFVAATPVISSFIRPSDNMAVPVIDTQAAALPVNNVNAPAPETAVPAQPQPKEDSVAAWPIVGRITTYFGVPHQPYQPTHTGLDISSSRPSGVMPVKPFKPGKVIETVRSRSGLGNFVVVDHGGGVTSVYAHLDSISVQPGQNVNQGITLGYEGSSGVSTGTHLHFEIRQNGQPVNPLPFLTV